MIRSLKEIEGYGIQAKDRRIGHVADFLFDVKAAVVRYLVVDTRNWLLGKKVLIALPALGTVDSEEETFSVGLTADQVKESPDMEADRPVSRQKELELHRYYEWAPYWWPAGGLEGGALTVPAPEEFLEEKGAVDRRREAEDPNLWSLNDIAGYDVHASDGAVGHIEDMLANDSGWLVRYYVINTRKWLPGGRHILVASDWVTNVSWNAREAAVDLSRDIIRSSPEYDSSQPVSREYEGVLYEHYGKSEYWLAR
ncbi:PRC-barrel domain-containing protein [bacterium]|nr:PRC-barrel domain-containing protein [bacterium]